jgi:cation transport ATPase
MNEIKLNTNLHCGSCEVKLGKTLNAEKKIKRWSADLKSPGKVVTIHGELQEREAIEAVHKAGFTATPVTQSNQKRVFWKDRKIWNKAAQNTLNCLIGCSIGDFAMIIFLQVYYPSTPMWQQMLLAIIAGLITSVALETTILHMKEKLIWKRAFIMAVSMSFISMVGMEIVMNVTDFMITGGKAALTSPAYWMAFIPAALAGFLAPLPYNYYQLRKYSKSCH